MLEPALLKLRQGVPLSRYRPKGVCLISIGNPKLIAAAAGADRVQYCVRKLGHRLIGISFEPLS